MAIFNKRDYRLAKAKLTQLQSALEPDSVVEGMNSGLAAEVHSARRQALRSEAERVSSEIEGYEKLRSISGESESLSTEELGLIPIVARIARGLSQRELAELLEVSEQQIQRYEGDRYASVNLTRYQKLLDILGVEIQSKFLSSSGVAKSAANAESLEITDSLISAVRRSGWLSIPKGAKEEQVAELLAAYLAEGEELSRGRTFHRRFIRDDDQSGSTGLALWQARVLKKAALARQKLKSKFNIVDVKWLIPLVRLSQRSDGPARAIQFLAEHGIILVVAPHLPHTRLDGAAMLLFDGTPVIALTLRHDRIDSFWFTLLHEVAHVFLHFNHGLEAGFVDNIDIESSDAFEKDADRFAQSTIISDQAWQTAPARFAKSPDLVRKFAESLGIHAAIVAGRIRKERGDYKIFSDLVGQGTLRPLFAEHLESEDAR